MVSSKPKIAPAAIAPGHWNHYPSPIASSNMPWPNQGQRRECSREQQRQQGGSGNESAVGKQSHGAGCYARPANSVKRQNPAPPGNLGLPLANANRFAKFGSPEQIGTFVEPMLAGRFTGTMALSETQAGSSLADITTRAEPHDDGSYRRRHATRAPVEGS